MLDRCEVYRPAGPKLKSMLTGESGTGELQRVSSPGPVSIPEVWNACLYTGITTEARSPFGPASIS